MAKVRIQRFHVDSSDSSDNKLIVLGAVEAKLNLWLRNVVLSIHAEMLSQKIFSSELRAAVISYLLYQPQPLLSDIS